MADNVHERVAKVVAETLDLEPSQVVDGARFVEDLGSSSMQSVELIAAFEEEFDIEMDEEEAFDVKTVGDAVAFVAKYLHQD